MDTILKSRLEKFVSEYNSTPCPHCKKQHQISYAISDVGEEYIFLCSSDFCKDGTEDLKEKIRQFKMQPVVDFMKVICQK